MFYSFILYRGKIVFTGLPVRGHISQVRDMGCMFTKAVEFNQPFDRWDVSNVTSMVMMFYEASSFNQRLDNWEIANVNNMKDLFFI